MAADEASGKGGAGPVVETESLPRGAGVWATLDDSLAHTRNNC